MHFYFLRLKKEQKEPFKCNKYYIVTENKYKNIFEFVENK